MAKIATVTTGTTTVTHEKPIQSLGIVATLDAAVVTAINADPSSIVSILYAADDCTVTVLTQSPSGDVRRQYNAQSLLSILEYAQFNEGCITIQGNVLRGNLPLSKTGMIPFMNDETLSVEITNGGSLFDSIDIHTMELPLWATDYTKFRKLSVQQGQLECTFDLVDTDHLMIPIPSVTATTEFVLHYSNGTSPRYKLEELIQMGLMTQEMTFNYQGGTGNPTKNIAIGGFGRFAILSTAAISSVDLFRASTSSFDMIAVTSELIESTHLRKAVSTNAELEDLTASVREVQYQQRN